MPDAEATKLNPAFLMALRAWRQTDPAERNPDDGITVTVTFEGDLKAIEAAGFESHLVTRNEAMGAVRFKDVPALLALPGVLWLASGMPRKPHDTAVPDIKARNPAGGTLGTDGLWNAVVATGALTQIGAGKATGKDVIVAIIDSGIDYTHPMFMSSLGPPRTTRIKRIWDQGLTPPAVANCPDAALLIGGRYGQEFKEADINTAINAGPLLPHKDCEGHGTHVAGIAAGGVVFGPGGDASKIGVAPEADIIAVKLLDVPTPINFVPPTGTPVDEDRRFRDAVIYCLRVAKAEGKPVVINMSFGTSFQPGDGLDSEATFIDDTLDPAHVADSTHFPSGAIAVRASGNDGDITRRMTAVIEVPAAGEVTVPLAITDNRGGANTKFKRCADTLHGPSLFGVFWYKRDFDRVKFAVKLPFRNFFEGGGDMGVGGNFHQGYLVRPGPPAQLVNVAISPTQHEIEARHGGEPAVPHPAGGTVRRHQFFLKITPKVVGGVVTYLLGTYEVRIRAPAGTKVFFMGDREKWGAGLDVILGVGTTMADGTPIPPAVDAFVQAEFSATDTLGKNATTVAAYDDSDHKLARFSSRGPLRDFSDPPGSKPLVADKPELSAPGVGINSAEGVDTNVGVGIRVPPWTDGVRFVEHQGTSMSAPMVAGVIALMLNKNPALTAQQVNTILTTAAAGRLGVDPAGPGTAHDRAYGKGMADALASHNGTP